MLSLRSAAARRVWSATGRALSLSSGEMNKLTPLCRGYHSYPDPNEKPVVSTFKSDGKKMGEKAAIALKNSLPMDVAFPGSPTPTGIGKNSAPTIKESTLSNGLTVTSQELPGSLMVTLGFIVKCGSAYENQTGPNSTLGASHFLELNAFRTTSKRSHEDIVKKLEQLGGSAQCIFLRENIFYCVDVLKENVEEAFDILAETITAPAFPEEELAESRDIVQFQAVEAVAETFSRDLVQRAAYAGSPLGNHHFCPLDSTEQVTAKTLHDFRSKHFFGENCLLSVVGLGHDEVMRMVTPRFQALPKGNAASLVRPAAQYKGGLLVEERELKDPNFIKVCMAFEDGGWNSPNLVPMCVIQTLLGGGSSFSAGGPGKGMYTRLYTQVLNKHYWTEAVEAFTAVNDNCGLLGIDTSCPPDYVANAIIMVIEQFAALAKTPVTNEELNRAKNMLKSMMMMNLESRLMICEDTVRQYATYGRRKSPSDLCQEIDNVTAQDLMNVARSMLSKPPSLSVVGQGAQNVPAYEDLVHFTKVKAAL